MGWKERLEPASFAGLTFFHESHTSSKGRRVTVNRFAGRDGSAQQDHNREPDELDVVAFVWGDDYDVARDELEEALLKPGVQTLTLPTRGELRVSVTYGPLTSEHKDEGGYCSIRFRVVVETGELGRVSVRDTSGALRAASARTRAATARDFATRTSTRGLPARYLARTTGAVSQLSRTLGKAQRMTQGVLSPVTALTSSLDELGRNANSLLSVPSLFATTAIDLVFTTFALADTITGGLERITGLPLVLLSAFDRGRPARTVDRALEAFRDTGEAYSSVTSSALGRRADENTLAVQRLGRSAALSAAADQYAALPFDSATFALAALDNALSALDALERETNPSDDLFDALEAMRAALAAHLLETASNLPSTTRYTQQQSLPALVIAHDLYGDATREGDLIARNGIASPLFVRGVLEVLST
jgi:hypothetical protein